MTDRLAHVSSARILAGATSLLGLAMIGLIYALSSHPSPILALFVLPFLTVLVVSIVEMPPFTRAVFLWIAAAAAIFPAALTIFSGIGFFLAAVILAWLVAAWQESREST